MPARVTRNQLRSILQRAGRRRNVSASGQRAAQAEGGSFQKRAISDAYTSGLTLWEIPSGCKWIAKGRPVPVKTPFDVFGAIPWQGGRLICFDAKRVSPNDSHSGFSLSAHAEPHQLTALWNGGEGGAVSGLLIECGPCRDVRWLDWQQLRRPGNIVPWADYSRWHIIGPVRDRIDFRNLTAMFSVAFRIQRE